MRSDRVQNNQGVKNKLLDQVLAVLLASKVQLIEIKQMLELKEAFFDCVSKPHLLVGFLNLLHDESHFIFKDKVVEFAFFVTLVSFSEILHVLHEFSHEKLELTQM